MQFNSSYLFARKEYFSVCAAHPWNASMEAVQQQETLMNYFSNRIKRLPKWKENAYKTASIYHVLITVVLLFSLYAKIISSHECMKKK